MLAAAAATPLLAVAVAVAGCCERFTIVVPTLVCVPSSLSLLCLRSLSTAGFFAAAVAVVLGLGAAAVGPACRLVVREREPAAPVAWWAESWGSAGLAGLTAERLAVKVV